MGACPRGPCCSPRSQQCSQPREAGPGLQGTTRLRPGVSCLVTCWPTSEEDSECSADLTAAAPLGS